jgi:short-subunit dehydrogenase
MPISNLKQKYGQWALVAGASKGIGAAFSNYLAAERMDLVLIARNRKDLKDLATSLIDRYKIQVSCISCDLSDANAANQIKSAVQDMEISLLVYNAALSYIGPFEKNSLEHHNQIARANMITPMNLVQIFGEPMLKNGRGALILMASLAGFQGSGFLAAYASTKAFNRVLAESLWYEWKGRGVDVMACCAGATSSPNFIESNAEPMGFLAPRVLAPEEVVEECFRNLGKRPSIITGRGNRIASFFMQKVFPRKMAVKIMGDNTRKIYRL